jgi:hypothetical protein
LRLFRPLFHALKNVFENFGCHKPITPNFLTFYSENYPGLQRELPRRDRGERPYGQTER